MVRPDLADNQYGFRQGRSTVDAIMRVKALAEEAVSRSEVVSAVSLDIANAFNTLPWSCIREALVYHEVPLYLRRIVGAYLSERAVVYPSRTGLGRREMSCGVPQGYPGLVLDGRWDFGYRCRGLVPKLVGAARALARLLPNMKGPEDSCRRLYSGVVRSMALYGYPVWAGALKASNVAILRRRQRVLAIRIIRGYRTISFEAASLLAGTPPWDLEARALAALYQWRKEARELGRCPEIREIDDRKSQHRQVIIGERRERLGQPSAGHAVIAAVRPVMEDWPERRHGTLSYRLTQVITGKGYYGDHLCLIRKEPTPEWHHCDGQTVDKALHTLAECPARYRRRLRRRRSFYDLRPP
ncbi:unnamed protein product [Arctia plantaginis]|uniref:Reverse transcriptase domain-containing protein n=1 Tax=Arctia plantaginis TaxID=874455 RepID=A0A8S1AF78_ARCPL|nr:unnamed protein product [Arctia plantaginis]